MEFKEIDQQLLDNSIVRFNYDILNPINKKEEYKKFLESNKTYNPQFKYNSFNAQPFVKALENINIPQDSTLGKIFEEIRQDLLIEGKLLTQIGTDNFDGTELFDEVSEELYQLALKIIKETSFEDDEEEEIYSSQELKEILKKELNKYNLHDWNIVISENTSSSVSVSSGKKTITIKGSENFSKTHATKLTIHEIGTHVLRSVNGEQQEWKTLSVGFPDYLATEEGLAGYNERSQGIESPQTIVYYAQQALVTYLAAKYGFVETFQKFRPYCETDKQAFSFIARAKRGLGDTSKPGGYLKDHKYLLGYTVIEEFIKNGGNIKDLYVGKIGIKDINLIQEGILKPASIIPDFLK